MYFSFRVIIPWLCASVHMVYCLKTVIASNELHMCEKAITDPTAAGAIGHSLNFYIMSSYY